jgi:hypothetical protein
LELLPDVQDREKALDALREVQLRGESAIQLGTILTPQLLDRLFLPIEGRDLLVNRVWVNVHNFADLRKYGRDRLELVTERVKLQQGIYAHLGFTEIRCSKKIPQGFVYMTASDEGDGDLASDWVPDASKLVKL